MKYCLLIIIAALLGACSHIKPVPTSEPTPVVIENPPVETAEPEIKPVEKTFLEKLTARYEDWRGTKYRMGSLNRKNGVDCSGFVLLTFRDLFGIELPRSTREQNLLGKEIKKDQLQTGDLVFFHTGRTKHVGIYMENNQFLHASTRAGVKISNLNEAYWKRNYWKAKRLDLNQLAQTHPVKEKSVGAPRAAPRVCLGAAIGAPTI